MEFSKTVENELLELADSKYLEFNQSLNAGNSDAVKAIGVRVPMLRGYANKLSKEYSLDYLLNNINENYYEEIMLKGILIGCYKNLSYNELEKYIRYYVPKIFDWGLCDIFCASLKITKKYLKEVWKILKEYLKSNNEFEVRFTLVMILNYYINYEYIDEIYSIVYNVKLDKYYVKMANAWLISYLLIKYYDKTIMFLKDNKNLDNWTYNKGIQKAIESFRITSNQKEELKTLKKHTKN